MTKEEKRCYKRKVFKNQSEPLLEDFREMYSTLEIKTADEGKNQVQVSRKDIEKFIEKVDPIKAQKS